MTTRSVLGLVFTLQGLQQQGYHFDDLLEKHGFSLRQISPEAEIDRSLELQILTDVASRITDPLAGLKISTGFSLAGYGPFVMLLMTCSNTYEAFQTGIRFQQLAYLFGELRLAPGEPCSALCIDPLPLPDVVHRFLIDRDASGTLQLVEDLRKNLGIHAEPQEVWLPYPRPAEYAEYEKRFGCPVHFGGQHTRFLIRNQDLSTPFISANRTAHALYRNQCEQLLTRRQRVMAGLPERIREHLMLFSDKLPSTTDVARTFGLSERSLRRQLHEESASFRSLVEQVRFKRASDLLLDSRQPVEAIAQKLGYSESAAFVHAFRRWTGMSPAAWRRDQAGNH